MMQPRGRLLKKLRMQSSKQSGYLEPQGLNHEPQNPEPQNTKMGSGLLSVDSLCPKSSEALQVPRPLEASTNFKCPKTQNPKALKALGQRAQTPDFQALKPRPKSPHPKLPRHQQPCHLKAGLGSTTSSGDSSSSGKDIPKGLGFWGLGTRV